MYCLKFLYGNFQDMENFLILILILLYLHNFALYDHMIYNNVYFSLIFFIKFVIHSLYIL